MKSTLASPSRREMFRLLGLAGLGSLALKEGALWAASAEPTPPSTFRQPGAYRFKIGSIEAWAFNDGGMAAPVAQSPFAVGEPPEKVAAVLQDNFLNSTQINLTFNVLLVRLGAELILIDTGCGGAFGPAGGHLVDNLATAGFRPDQITGVFITHLHGDHVGGLLDGDGRRVFKNAKVFIHREEHAFWSAGDPKGPMGDFVSLAQRYLKAYEGEWQMLQGGEKLLPGLEIFHAPGHTPGHIIFELTSGQERLLHWVDVAHHHAISLAHPEWVLQWDADAKLAVETRRKILERAASDRSRIFGAHMPFPALGHVRRAGNGFEYLIEPWAF